MNSISPLGEYLWVLPFNQFFRLSWRAAPLLEVAAALASLMRFADKNIACSSRSSSALLALEADSGLEDQLILRPPLFFFLFLVRSGDGALGGLATYTLRLDSNWTSSSLKCSLSSISSANSSSEELTTAATEGLALAV